MGRTGEQTTAAELIPPRAGLDELREIAAGCRACELWRSGTQTVFGEGPDHARAVIVGEQPGDKEDLSGRPFVGPAGRLLDEALERAGIAREETYVTNVVKHFKWEARGKRRLHQKPDSAEIAACRPWLEAEVERLGPEVVVLLGATAAKAILGAKFRVTRQRGELVDSPLAPHVMATIHPSAILRAPDSATRREETDAFVEDLRVAARVLNGG